MNKWIHFFLFVLLFSVSLSKVNAQKYLSKTITIQVHQQAVSTVLQSISQQGGFYFSYKSNLLPNDSLVTISVKNQSVEVLLNTLLGNRFQYKERGNHIIILPSETPEKMYLSGTLTDGITGERINYASIYEEDQLVSTMSNADGYFQLQLKEYKPQFNIRIRKMSYKDTLIRLENLQLNNVQIQLEPQSYLLDSVVVNGNNKFENSWLGRLLLSSRLRTNSLNLGNFIASRPYQVSLIPGLGTHGRMSTQVDNKFSLNVLGGYTAGVEGFEVGGLFNIVKSDMDYAQVAGLFNIVNGEGRGFQVAGIFNSINEGFTGIQISGISSHVGKDMNGLQISGLVNTAITMKGFQFAFLNFVDSSDGYSVGFLNFIKNGYKKITVNTTENQHLNVAFKTGNNHLYSIIHVGLRLDLNEKAYSFGYGLGHQSNLGKKISLNPELIESAFYLGNWSMLNSVVRFQLHLKYQLSPNLAIFAGPSVSVQYDSYINETNGYQQELGMGYPSFRFSKKVHGWIGWSMGLELF